MRATQFTILGLAGLVLALLSAGHPISRFDREFPRPYDQADVPDAGPAPLGEELAENLITNGGFESWSEREVVLNPGLPGSSGRRENWSLPEGWQLHHWEGPDIGRAELEQRAGAMGRDLELKAAGPHGGKAALDIGFGAPDGGLWFGSDLFPVEPGADYLLTMWLEARDGDGEPWPDPYVLKILLRAFADPQRAGLKGISAWQHLIKLDPEVKSFPWRRLEWRLTLPQEAQWVTLQLKPLHSGPDRLVVDDIALRKIVMRARGWRFDSAGGFGRARRDNVVLRRRGLELAPVADLLGGAGGFEHDGDGDGLPDGWTADHGGHEPDQRATGRSRVRYGGSWGLQVRATGGRVDLTTPPLDLPEPGTYTLSAWVHSPPREGPVPQAVPFLAVRRLADGRTVERNVVQADGSWLRQSISFVHPGKGDDEVGRDSRVQLVVGVGGSGVAWFDEVQLERAPWASRLARLGAAFADRGTVVSRVVTLGPVDGARVSWRAQVPAGRRLELATRTGFTPYFDPATWTAWSRLPGDSDRSQGVKVDLEVRGVPLYLQWRATFCRDDPDLVTASEVNTLMEPVASLASWRYWRGDSKGNARVHAHLPTPYVEGLALPPAGREPSDPIWFATDFDLSRSVTAGQLLLHLPFTPALKRSTEGWLKGSTETTVLVNGVQAGRRSGGAEAWFQMAHLVEPGSRPMLEIRVAGPGSDRFIYLTRARVLHFDPASDGPMRTTPRLHSVTVEVEGPRARRHAFGDVEITRFSNGRIVPGLVAARAPTDEEIAADPGHEAVAELAREIIHNVPMSDEDAQILRLRKHIYALCNATGRPNAYELEGPAAKASSFLQLAAQDKMTMYCTHHWQAFYDLASAVGIVVRPVTTSAMGKHHQWADNVIEYWSNLNRRWVMVNTFWDQVFYRRGEPQSAADLMKLWYDDMWHEVEVRAGGQLSNDFRASADRAVGPMGWEHIAPHENATSHGWVEQVTVRAAPADGPGVTLVRPDTQPFFIGRHDWSGQWPITSDAAGLYGPVNQTRLRLSFSDGECSVAAEHNMPGFDHFEQRLGDGAWTRCSTMPFVWPLAPGGHVLRVRAVNRQGRPGPESTVMLRSKMPSR